MPGLTRDQIDRYHDQGYLFVPGFFAPEEIQPAIDEFAESIDRVARRLRSAGRIDSLYEEESFQTRLCKLVEQCNDAWRFLFDVSHGGREFFALLRHEKILDVAESLLGPELRCHPAYRIRAKLPGGISPEKLKVIPWHQDSAYFDAECDRHLFVGFWVALTETSVDHGCMEVVPEAHKRGILEHHNIKNRSWLDIPEYAAGDVDSVLLPAHPGDLLLLTNLIPHRSGPNRTQQVRWNFDCRYHHASSPSGFPSRAGFLASSRIHPGEVVDTFEEFERSRTAHAPRRIARWDRWPIVSHDPSAISAAR